MKQSAPEYLVKDGSDETLDAFRYLGECEAGGDVANFSRQQVIEYAQFFCGMGKPGDPADGGSS